MLYKPFDAIATLNEQWGEPRYAAYILPAKGQVRWVDLGEAKSIHSQIYYSFLRPLWRTRRTPDQILSFKKASRALEQKLMRPIREHLDQDVNHILIAPDSQLNLIPFEALVDENNQYLVENYTFTYLTSGRDLLRLQINNVPEQPPLIVANPNFQNKGYLGFEILAQTNNSNSTFRGMRATYNPLPGTQKEAEALKSLLPNAIVLTGSQATENAIKAARSPQILHLATHGFFLPAGSEQRRENPLLRSGLALAGYNQRSSDGEDGVLTALEVASLNLRGTQLVVLSACQTGRGEMNSLGQIYGIGEGVYGLRRAFVIAGARSQLSSLWDVDDFATQKLMKKYYQRLIAGENISEAWRQTQLEMLQSQQYQHPHYWAAFISSGDWRAITLTEL